MSMSQQPAARSVAGTSGAIGAIVLVVIQLALALITVLVGWFMPGDPRDLSADVIPQDPSAPYVHGLMLGSAVLWVVSLVLVILRIKARRRAFLTALCCFVLQIVVFFALVYGQEWGWF